MKNNTLCVFSKCLFSFSSTLAAYYFCRSSSAVFDLSYKRHIRLKGPTITSIGDRLIGSRPCPSELPYGDVGYGCILDFKGKVMDDCWIFKTHQNHSNKDDRSVEFHTDSNSCVIDLITSGFEFETLRQFLEVHFIYLR